MCVKITIYVAGVLLMRNFLKILLFSLLCILTVSVTALATDDAKVLVNGEYIEMDQKPIFKDDRILWI